MSWNLFIEGVGDIPENKLDQNTLFLFRNLPKGDFEVLYIQNWPLLIIKLPISTHSYASYYLQYNPQSKVIKRLIKHEINEDPNKINPSIIDDKYLDLINSGDISRLYDAQQTIKKIRAKYGQ